MDSFDGSRRRELRASPPAGERRLTREGDPLDQRLDRWMEAGRQLVEGVSGNRPGSRPGARRAEGRPMGRRGFDGLGRWVEERLDWLIDDDGDDWREPWQENESRPRPQPSVTAATDPVAGGGRRPRRPLEARSRRGDGPPAGEPRAVDRPAGVSHPSAAQSAMPPAAVPGDWPDDDSFTLPRWSRPASGAVAREPVVDPAPAAAAEGAPARPLPRSSRRR